MTSATTNHSFIPGDAFSLANCYLLHRGSQANVPAASSSPLSASSEPHEERFPSPEVDSSKHVPVVNPSQLIAGLNEMNAKQLVRLLVKKPLPQDNKIIDYVREIFLQLMWYKDWDASESNLLPKLTASFSRLSPAFQENEELVELYVDWTTSKWVQLKSQEIKLTEIDVKVKMAFGLWGIQDASEILDIDDDYEGCKTKDGVTLEIGELRKADCEKRFNHVQLNITSQVLEQRSQAFFDCINHVRLQDLETKYLGIPKNQ